ncbi:MAG TPA: hypothetical protein VKT49_08280 [Bryobacteraceae bacterium]|nr:hypothetical protein [Bryobacteraceae bacterium]
MAGIATAQPHFETDVRYIVVEGTPAVMYAGWDLLNGAGSALFRSADEGASWAPVYLTEPGLPQPQIRSFVVDPTNPAVLFVATNPAHGGIWRSADSGATWSSSNTGLPSDDNDVQSLFIFRSNHYRMYARTARSVYTSADAGKSWTLRGALPAEAAAFTINSGDTSHMYLATAAGVIYHSADEGATWLRMSAFTLQYGNSKDTLTDLVSAPLNSRLVFAGVRGGLLWVNAGSGAQYLTGLHWSQDFGATWNNIAPGQQVSYFYPDPAGRSIGYYTYSESAKVCKTLNLDSQNWNCVSLTGWIGAVHLWIQSATPDTMYGATMSGIYKSTDGAATWHYLDGTVRPTLVKPDSINITLVAGTQGYRKLDVRALEDELWKMEFTASAAESWLSVSPASGTSAASIQVTVNAGGLAVGSYQGTVQIASQHAANSAVSVPVRLSVIPPAARGPAYDLTTIAGTGKYGFSGDGGPALAAQLADVAAVALDSSGALYLADSGNNRVRQVTPGGAIRTIAGTGHFGSAGDNGPAIDAQLWRPQGVGAIGGKVYIGDTWNSSLRVINSAGIISTILDLVTALPLREPRGIAVSPQGEVFVADSSYGRVVKLSATGAPSIAARNFYKSADVAVDASGMLYVADSGHHRIVRVDPNGNAVTVAGTGLEGFDGDGGPATAASLASPEGVAVDQAGQIYIADTGNHRIRVISPQGTIRTVAGTGTAGSDGAGGPAAGAQLKSPTDVVVDSSGALFVADRGNSRVVKLTLQPGSGPRISAGGVLHAASYEAETAPGALFSIFGVELASGPAEAAGMPWPLNLAGTSVTVDGRPAPIYYAGANQINAQVPYETSLGTAQVVVASGDNYTVPAPLTVGAAVPGIFQASQGWALAQHPDNSLNGPENRVAAGSVIVVYLTGQGLLDNPIATGAAAPAGPLSRPMLPVAATIGGQPAEVLFLGMTPGLIGLAQANIRVPALPEGHHPLVITIGVKSSKPALLAIGP